MTRMSPMKIVDLSLIANLFVVGCVDDGQAVPDAAEDVENVDDVEHVEATERDDLHAPAPGSSVWSELVFTDGTTQQFMLHTTLAGEVVFEEHSDERFPQAADPATPAEPLALAACSDDAYILQGWQWKAPLAWSFAAGSTPDGLTADAAEAAISAATTSVTSSDNSCGVAGELRAAHVYLGRHDRPANIGAAGDCRAADGASVVAFGELPPGVLAATCVWFADGVVTESDVQLGQREDAWTTDPGAASCSGRWSLQTVMTHQRGHTLGLAHVGERAHGELTMSPALNGPCQDGESTLGDGDLQGLRAMY